MLGKLRPKQKNGFLIKTLVYKNKLATRVLSRLDASISMVKRILNLKIILKISYCIIISTFVMRPANYAVVTCYNSTEKLNEQNEIANFMMFK